ncbi:MAG: methyltransferase family protein [Sphingomonas sp.]|uniref:methyltransferase family protein n=4 Tax=Pseudomonadota TaxID=1224 RepID=UPI0030FD107D
MFHDTALARAAKAADPRPVSAVSTGCGLAGLGGLFLWVAIARYYGMDGPYAALVNIAACALPMVLWAVLVDKVHRRPSTGIDWSTPKPWRETLDVSLTKLAGLWATWAGIALIYGTGRYYWRNQWGGFPFAMACFGVAAPLLLVGSIPYVLWIDRRLVAPKDGAWALGAWLMGLDEPIDREALYNHLRSWGVKAFFLAFMLAVVPPGFAGFIHGNVAEVLHNPVALANWLIGFMFVIDCAFATAGYILTFRPLDSHIRSANPFAAAWMAALICYPPFTLMAENGPLDYHPGTYGSDGWSVWFAGHPVVLVAIGTVLVGLTAIYAWATVAFGFRFSNLTHRGILTHGPYAFSRHPAYLSKNLFWWISTVPVLTTGSWLDAVRATILMGVVSGVYYWRAKTEERHLGMDPTYRDYSEWIERNGLVPRFFAWVGGKRTVRV